MPLNRKPAFQLCVMLSLPACVRGMFPAISTPSSTWWPYFYTLNVDGSLLSRITWCTPVRQCFIPSIVVSGDDHRAGAMTVFESITRMIGCWFHSGTALSMPRARR